MIRSGVTPVDPAHKSAGRVSTAAEDVGDLNDPPPYGPQPAHLSHLRVTVLGPGRQLSAESWWFVCAVLQHILDVSRTGVPSQVLDPVVSGVWEMAAFHSRRAWADERLENQWTDRYGSVSVSPIEVDSPSASLEVNALLLTVEDGPPTVFARDDSIHCPDPTPVGNPVKSFIAHDVPPALDGTVRMSIDGFTELQSKIHGRLPGAASLEKKGGAGDREIALRVYSPSPTLSTRRGHRRQ